jgi:hypothetical protein
MKVLAALALGSAMACSSPPRRDAAPTRTDDAPAPVASEHPRDVGAVVVAADFIVESQYIHERHRLDDAAIGAAARACLDQHVPVASRPDAGQWVIGVTWSPSSARVTPELVAQRSLVGSEPVPEALASCVAETSPQAAIDMGRVEALIAIRTRGWLAHHDEAATPLDDPERAWVISIWRRAEHGDGSTRDLDDEEADVRRVARACADEVLPVRARTEPIGWGILHTWRNPDGTSSGGGFGASRDSANPQNLPYHATPAGFEDCVQRSLPTPRHVDGQVVAIKTNIEVATRAWIDANKYGVLGHGKGVP